MVTMPHVHGFDIDIRILMIRGQKVMLDTDLAELYGVSTKALNQATKRNSKRFPIDFMFQLSAEEKLEVVTKCDHLRKLKFSKTQPFAFTEHGAIQVANVLNSDQAVEMGLYVVRAFVRLRGILASNSELARRVEELEKKTELNHAQIEKIFAVVRQLMVTPEPTKRPIGFVVPSDK